MNKCVITERYSAESDVVLKHGDCKRFLQKIPAESVKLVFTSPPYNVGKSYESKKRFNVYLKDQDGVLESLVKCLHYEGSLCWQVGSYVGNREVFPLDIFYYEKFKKLGLYLRNRIIWKFGHGLHAKSRLSGRYETILWFTKSDRYTFNLDPIRIPSKYPDKKHYRGPNAGKLSGNPMGKNPSDFWDLGEEWRGSVWDVPNVKSNHPEKSIHPCQFPVELAERCVLALTNENDWVLDPFGGVGSTAIAALKNGRKSISVEKEKKYVEITRNRISSLIKGDLKLRQMGKPVHVPVKKEGNENSSREVF